jgi:hypothetical protein
MNTLQPRPLGLFVVVCFVLVSSSCSSLFGSFGFDWSTAGITRKRSVDDITVGSEPLNWNNREFEDFTTLVWDLMKKHDFAGLDALAADFRTTKARFTKGGGWKIHSFYLLTAAPESYTEKGWTSLIRFLKAWKDATGSIAARSSLAKAYIDYAWLARGSGFVKDVPPEAWPIFQERMELAAAEVLEAMGSKEKCYGYFEVLLRMGRGGGMDRAQFDQAFAQAIDYDRSYQYFYTEKAQYLMPRWHGRPGELADFANEVWDTLGEIEGPKIYYLIVAEIHGYNLVGPKSGEVLKTKEKFFEIYGFKWRKTKIGFIQYEKDHGISRFRLNEFAAMSWTAMDSQALCNTFLRLTGENDYDPEPWRSDGIGFRAAMNIALTEMCKSRKFDNQAP